jgi:nucleoside-diphosphate-sugar epimerase
MCPSIKKISEKLGYKPSYTPEETMERAVNWMRENGMI